MSVSPAGGAIDCVNKSNAKGRKEKERAKERAEERWKVRKREREIMRAESG